MKRLLPIVAALLLWSAGCTKARPVEGERACPSWEGGIANQLVTSCASCHSGKSAEAGFDVTTYVGALGVDQPERFVSPGLASSKLLTILGDGATAPHSGFGVLREQLEIWVMRCQLAYRDSDVHARGLLDPASPDFHAKLLRSRNYDFAFCQSCHGMEFDGGKSNASCMNCHEQKPDQCSTCHGASGPQTGAHRAHTQAGPIGKALDCSECHVVPEKWSSPGHILDDRGQLDPAPAEVVFGPTAGLDPYPRGLFGGPAPQYVNGTCSNVYCHAPNASDSAATNSTPQWADSGARSCTTCHGTAPAGHPVGDCANCHARVVSGSGQLASSALHLDGKVSLGDDSGTCQACHANLGGAHASHLQPPHKLANPIACTECHLLPTQVLSPGHLDDTPRAEVFPASGLGPIAAAFNASPLFDATEQRCSDVACHGGGDKLTRDKTTTIDRQPAWAIPPVGTGPSVCGGCHGLPPADGIHDSKWKLQQCSICHPSTLDATGAFRYVDGKTTHADGHVDVP